MSTLNYGKMVFTVGSIMNNHFKPTGEYGVFERSNGTYSEEAGIARSFGDMSQGM